MEGHPWRVPYDTFEVVKDRDVGKGLGRITSQMFQGFVSAIQIARRRRRGSRRGGDGGGMCMGTFVGVCTEGGSSRKQQNFDRKESDFPRYIFLVKVLYLSIHFSLYIYN